VHCGKTAAENKELAYETEEQQAMMHNQ